PAPGRLQTFARRRPRARLCRQQRLRPASLPVWVFARPCTSGGVTGMAKAKWIHKQGGLDLDAEAFGARFNEGLVHECVRAELNALRQGTAATRSRAEVRGGGSKPWRQKGTGRARAGSIRSPIWTGGGAAFGPSPRRYTVKVN